MDMEEKEAGMPARSPPLTILRLRPDERSSALMSGCLTCSSLGLHRLFSGSSVSVRIAMAGASPVAS